MKIPSFVFDRATAPQPLFTAGEVADWPPGLLQELLQQGVIKPTDNAQAVTCDACGHNHVEPVTYLPSGPAAKSVRTSPAPKLAVSACTWSGCASGWLTSRS